MSGVAQSGPPPLPSPSTYPYLDSWSFYDPVTWDSDMGYAPIGFTNIIDDTSCWSSDDGVLDCNGLILDSTNAAYLNYNVVEHDGNTNLICQAGVLWFWFSPDWSSTNQGGTGPGNWGQFIDAGAWTTNADFGYWGLSVDAAGDNIYFSGQTNGASTNYLTCPISWTAGSWHLIGLVYSASNSVLYVDGQVATNGIGVSYWPGQDTITNGFWIGSDALGNSQARGEFVDVETYSSDFFTWYSTNYFSNYYNQMLSELPGGSFTGGFGGGAGDFDPPDLGGGGGGGYPNIYSTNLWLYLAGVQTNTIGLFLMNTEPDIEYEIQSKEDLLQSNWNSEGFAYGSEITNLTAMNLVQGDRTTNLFMRIRSWIDSDNVGIPDWWQLQYFGTIGINPYAASPAGDGFDIFSKYQNGLAPTTFVTPPAPNNFVAVLSTNGTNVLLSWDAAQGTVTNYAIERGVFDWDTFEYDYTPIGTVSGGTTSFTDIGAVSGGDEDDFTYQLTADYAEGSSQTASSYVYDSAPSPPAPPTPTYNINVSATLIRNATGRWQLMFPALPANAQAIQLIWGDGATTNILASSLTNGIYLIPDTVSVNHLGDTISVQGMQTNGESGTVVQAGVLANDAPYFVDGREHLKQNLIFLLMGATEYYSYMDDPYYPELADYRFNFSTNLEESSFLHRDSQYSGGDGSTWIALDNLWPFNVNYYLRNDVFDTNNPGPFSFNWTTNFSPNPAPPVLTNAEPYWIAQGADSNRMADVGVTLSTADGPYGVNTNYVSLQGGTFYNCYGLEAGSGEGVNSLNIIDPRTGLPYSGGLDYQAIGLGDTVNWVVAPLGNYWSQFQTPVLTNAGYYFAPLINPNINSMSLPSVSAQPIPLPLDDDFAVTNQTPALMIGAVGQPMIIGGWAKFAIQNGASDKFAYLGQYFVTNCFLLDTNGNATTNIAGILSPYGEFFPTQAGQAQLITTPDIDTGQQGTNIVQIISLNVDANHDGTMDLSYFGQDQTSPSKPYVFWANNNYDRLTLDADDNTFYDDDVQAQNSPGTPNQNTPDCNYLDGNGNRVIPCARDLEDFSRLWINGVTSNLLAALPSGSTVTLNWGDVGNPNSGNPTIDLFAAADVDGGIGYLTNSTIADEQIDTLSCPYIGRLAPGGSIQLNVSTFANNWAGNYFIWCGVTNGSGQLSLTFSDASGRVLGQASVYIQIVDIKQMYERWTVGDDPNSAPATTAQIAQDSLVTGETPFQYGPATTNTSYILLVHGWNDALWAKDRFAECAFKRLYWQGYQGRFGEFRWPTTFGFTGSFWQALTDPRNYDNGEYQAWQSAAGLLNLLTNLSGTYGNNVYVLAHSMGNVVTGEALRLAAQNGDGQLVNTYVASQAALPAHDYDSTVTTPYLLSFTYTYPTAPLSLLGSQNYGPFTPNIYGNRLTNNVASVGKRISYYNENDFALAAPRWCFDQITKPDYIPPNNYYGYAGSSSDPAPWNHFVVSPIIGGTDVPVDIVTNLNNLYKIMAYAAQSYSTALGATPGITNLVNLDLTTVWPPDPTENDYTEHFWHSAQFRGDCWQEWNYWQTLLRSSTLGFNISNP